MTTPDPDLPKPALDDSPELLFATALGAAIEQERGYEIPELRAIVLRLGNSSMVRWIRQHDDALERCSARWCPISAHVVLGTIAAIDECWPFTTAHFGAAAARFEQAHGSPFPVSATFAVQLREFEVESGLDGLRDALMRIPDTDDDCGPRVLDAFTRFAAIFRGIDSEWDARDRFLARALSLFEPLQRLSPHLSDAALREIRPLARL